MKTIISLILQRRMLAHVLTLAVLVLGLHALTRLPLAELPIVELGSVEIETRYPGASAEDVEANVTSRIEKELLSLSDIRKFESVSEEGLSSIGIQLKSDIKDTAQTYQDIRDAVSRVGDLPAGVTEAPSVRIKKSSSLDFMIVGIGGDLPYDQLRNHARALELKLRQLPGIGAVMPKDLRQKEYWIELEPDQLSRYALTLPEVADAIAKRNVLMSGGNLESYDTAQSLITLSELKTPEALAQTEVSRNPVVYLEDLSENIHPSFERPDLFASINGQRVIAFDLRTSDAADVTATAHAVRQLLAQEQKRLGDQVSLVVGFDLSDEIASKFNIVKNNGLVGLALVVLMLALMLNRHVALWVAMAIPFSLLGVIALLPALGQVLDSYTLAAMILIIGIIVDDAVVVSEKIVHRAEQGQAVDAAILEGLKDVMPAVLTSMTTTLLAFLPLMSLPGNTGKMLYVMPLTVGLALLFSLLDVMIVLPAHLRKVLQKKSVPTDNHQSISTGKTADKKGLSGDQTGSYKAAREATYQDNTDKRRLDKKPVDNPLIDQEPADKRIRLLMPLLKARYFTVLIATSAILGGGWLASRELPYLFFPTDGAWLIEIEAEVAPQASLEDAWRYSRELEAIIAADSEHIRRWYGQIGAPYSAFMISLNPSEDRSVSAEEIVEQWEEKVEQLEGFIDIELEVDAGGPPKGRPVDISVTGGNDAQREQMADDLSRWLEHQPGIRRVFSASEDQRPVVVADINYDLLNRYGITVTDLASTLRLAVDGERISRVFAGDEEVHYRILLEDNDRNLTDLEQLEIRSADGQLIPVRELVQWAESETPSAIKHYNGERSIRVSAAIDASVTDPVAIEDAMYAYFSQLDYGGVRLVSNGQARETREALNGLLMALGIALIAILLALVLLFDNLWESLLVMCVVPFGLAASSGVLWLHQEPLSFFAMVGMIGLVGVMVNNSLVLICHYKQQLAELQAQGDSDVNSTQHSASIEHFTSTEQRLRFVAQGSLARSRAVMLTTLTTVAGLIPLAYGLDGYDNYMGPIALVIGWGILAAAVVTLVLMPCFYAILLDLRYKQR